MLQKAKSSRRTPGGGDKAWASEAAVEGIKRLRQEVVTLLRALLVTLRQGDTDTLMTLLTSLQEKVRKIALLLFNVLGTHTYMKKKTVAVIYLGIF